MASLEGLQAALQHRRSPVDVFFRDDDAGWADDRLMALCERLREYDVPLDIATIPAALNAECLSRIDSLLLNSPPLFHIHQHGYAHANHEPVGRKSEFGVSRSVEDQFIDIERGHARMVAAFGDLVEPIFTPPWNRCTQDTVDALNGLGLSILSRNAGAQILDLGNLVEIPVQVDWVKLRREDEPDEIRSVSRLVDHLAEADVVGIMLHHEHMDMAELDLLESILKVLREAPQVRFGSVKNIASKVLN